MPSGHEAYGDALGRTVINPFRGQGYIEILKPGALIFFKAPGSSIRQHFFLPGIEWIQNIRLGSCRSAF